MIDVGATINDGRANPGSVGEFTSLVMNLGGKLTSRSEDKSGGVGFAGAAITVGVRVVGRRTGALGEGRGENGEEETSCLSGAGLRGA